MHLHVDDDGFVRAPTGLVYRRLTHVAAWPQWWPRTSVDLREADGDQHATISARPALGRRLRLSARLHGWRHDQGFALELRGDVAGHAEFWLEPATGGVVVHHLLLADTDHPTPLRLLADYRRWVRAGLWGVKDALELEVRTGAGSPP